MDSDMALFPSKLKFTLLFVVAATATQGLVSCKMQLRYYGSVPEPGPGYPHSRYHWMASVMAKIPPACHCHVTGPEVCSVKTEPSRPMSYKFVLPVLVAPFKLHFGIRASDSGIIALATGRNDEHIFCHITLGGWDNTRAAIRTGDLKTERTIGDVQIQSSFYYANQLSVDEDRAFWIEYENGVVRVGKGCEKDAFMEWDGTAEVGYHPKVNIAISTWEKVSGDWVFEERCI